MALILPFAGKIPQIAGDAFIADNATIIGDVVIGPQASVWFGCILRGDVNSIRIGARTNLQDQTVIHVDGDGQGTVVGDDVLVGHRAMLHGCTIETGSLIGMTACVLDGAVVETGAMVAAGALVSPNKRVKSGEVWAGCPARLMRPVSAAERTYLAEGVKHYCELAREYRAHQTDAAKSRVP